MLTIFSGGYQEKGRVELKKELDSAKENGKTIISIGPDQEGDIIVTGKQIGRAHV